MPRRNIHHELKVAEGNVVRLRHATRQGDWRFYHYNGELPVVDSLLTIPADRPEVIQRAWIQGFRMTAEGRVIADLASHIRAETAERLDTPCEHDGEVMVNEDGQVACAECGEPIPGLTPEDLDNDEEPETPVDETENAESEGDDEDSADRGQPAGDDGVRSSEPEGDGSIPEPRARSRRRDEHADGGEGD
jgi:uncharacterized Zn finger protein (UPF0148 family)